MSFLSRLKNTLRPRDLDQSIAEELEDHIEQRAEALESQGVAADEARAMAARRFGNATALKEQSREARMLPGLETFLLDLRYATRTIQRQPGFAVTAILSLAIAMGANSAVFSIVDAAMLRPLPVREPSKLFTLASPGISMHGEAVQESSTFSYPIFQQYLKAAGDTARLALFSIPGKVEVTFDAGGVIENANRQLVSGEAFEILGVGPTAGRLFSKEEDGAPGQHAVAVLSYDYWMRRFGGDRGAIGRRIQIFGVSYTIQGVAQQGFFGVEPGKFVDIWIPATMYTPARALTSFQWFWFRVIGRLEGNTTAEQLGARLQPAFHDLQELRVRNSPTMPDSIRQQFLKGHLIVRSGAQGVSMFRTQFQKPLLIVLGVAIAILLIACTNVASILLARSTSRAPEMAMRVSLGAGRGRLVRQLLTESLLLSSAAGLLGWVLARAAAPVLVTMLSTASDPVQLVLAMNTRVLLFSAGVSVLAMVVFGLIPAFQASNTQPIDTIRAASNQASGLALGRVFVTAQVAFAFVLVMAGAAFLFSLRNLTRIQPGFDPQNVAVLVLTSALPDNARAKGGVLMNELEVRAGRLPGVDSAAAVAYAFLGGGGITEQLLVPGRTPSERQEIVYQISPKYFATLRTPILEGRAFEAADTRVADNAPMPVIVNQALANMYFENRNPVGLEFSRPGSNRPFQIVGVAANALYTGLREGAEPMVYTPFTGDRGFTLYVRSSMPLGSVMASVEREAREVGSGLRVREVTTIEALVGNTIVKEKLLAKIAGAFAILGLLLAAIGLFGLLNYTVARRTKEIGVRSALGARPVQLVNLVLRDLAAMAGGGLVFGLIGALAAMRVTESLLFGVKAADGVVVTSAAAVFLGAALLSAALPARRAAAIDPAVALRTE
jgi:predicted permease